MSSKSNKRIALTGRKCFRFCKYKTSIQDITTNVILFFKFHICSAAAHPIKAWFIYFVDIEGNFLPIRKIYIILWYKTSIQSSLLFAHNNQIIVNTSVKIIIRKSNLTLIDFAIPYIELAVHMNSIWVQLLAQPSETKARLN